jgi:hypothetical protein
MGNRPSWRWASRDTSAKGFGAVGSAGGRAVIGEGAPGAPGAPEAAVAGADAAAAGAVALAAPLPPAGTVAQAHSIRDARAMADSLRESVVIMRQIGEE